MEIARAIRRAIGQAIGRASGRAIGRANGRAIGRANGRVGGKPRVLRGIVKAFRRPHRFARCRFARATRTAASQGFRTAHGFETGPMSRDAPHRRATRSWPKTLGNRLYESLSALLGISRHQPRTSEIDSGRCENEFLETETKY